MSSFTLRHQTIPFSWDHTVLGASVGTSSNKLHVSHCHYYCFFLVSLSLVENPVILIYICICINHWKIVSKVKPDFFTSTQLQCRTRSYDVRRNSDYMEGASLQRPTDMGSSSSIIPSAQQTWNGARLHVSFRFSGATTSPYWVSTTFLVWHDLKYIPGRSVLWFSTAEEHITVN